jgi:hypothetical protein
VEPYLDVVRDQQEAYMRPRRILVGGLPALFGVLALVGCGAVKTSPDTPLTSGSLTPHLKDEDVGLVAVAPGVDVKTFRAIVVERFGVAAGELQDEGDQRFAEKMSTILHAQLVRRLRESGLFQETIDATAGSTLPSGPTLRLRGTITRLGRGSRAARYFAGIYGAGRARVQADMQFVDASSQHVVIAVADRRVSHGVQWFGGDDEEILTEGVENMARDVAKFLTRLARGEAPRR